MRMESLISLPESMQDFNRAVGASEDRVDAHDEESSREQ